MCDVAVGACAKFAKHDCDVSHVWRSAFNILAFSGWIFVEVYVGKYSLIMIQSAVCWQSDDKNRRFTFRPTDPLPLSTGSTADGINTIWQEVPCVFQVISVFKLITYYSPPPQLRIVVAWRKLRTSTSSSHAVTFSWCSLLETST